MIRLKDRIAYTTKYDFFKLTGVVLQNYSPQICNLILQSLFSVSIPFMSKPFVHLLKTALDNKGLMINSKNQGISNIINGGR